MKGWFAEFCQVLFLLVVPIILLVVPLILLPTALWYGWVYATDVEPYYSVAIDSVSGLDPATDLGHRPAPVDPEFNLTARVASRRFWAGGCIEPGMYFQVSYRGVPLAASITATHRICAGPRKKVDLSIVAGGSGVVLPGSVLYSLAGDMRAGLPVFDVKIRGWWDLALSCGPKRVGDARELKRECARPEHRTVLYFVY